MADCSASVPPLDESGDFLYGPRICNQPFVDWAWDTYNFEYAYWQDGWGWDDCCNNTKPLARAFAGVWALVYSTPNNWEANQTNNMLEWGGRWVADQMSNYSLRATCGDSVATTYGSDCTTYRKSVIWDCTQYRREKYRDCSSWFFLFAWICYAWVFITSVVCIAWGWVASWVCAAAFALGGSKHVDLHQDYFYKKAVHQRASTFVHESRHISGKAHRSVFPAGSTYGAGKDGADESWQWNGAWRWQATWLAWYWAAAINTTQALRDKARDDANVIMLNAFEVSPGFTF